MPFQPPRTPTPLSDLSGDISTLSVAELAGLSDEDVEIIDAIVDRVGPDANRFLTVFKAYSDVLNERGLDPHEVVIYGKLLKLGTLRGSSWKEKWTTIKRHNGYLQKPTRLPPISRVKIRHLRPAESTTTLDSDLTTNTLGLDFSDNPVAHRVKPPPVLPPPSYHSTPKSAVLRSPRKGSVINDEEAWNKIKVSRDEKLADRFRNDHILERCWDMWKRGYEWILTTHAQIADARDQLILRIHIQHWHQKMVARREFYGRVGILANNRLLRSYFRAWYLRLKERQQAAWRQSMRNKIDLIRRRREDKLRKDAWAKWRQSFKSHLSDQHYAERLVLRVFRQWREKMCKLDSMAELADEAMHCGDHRTLEQAWNHWNNATQLRSIERLVNYKIGLRVMHEAMGAWKRRIADLRAADAYHDRVLLKSFIRSWKAAKDRINILETRADKHVVRQDQFLLRAVVRVWRAKANGRLLIQVKNLRLLKHAWAVWERRLRHEEHQRGSADAFYRRGNSVITATAFRTWLQVFTTHQNATSFASYRYSMQLGSQVLRRWQEHFIKHLKMLKKARQHERLVRVSEVWRTWKDRLQEKRCQSTLVQLKRRKLASFFKIWLLRANQQYQERLAERIFRQHSAEHALTYWTNRVIAIKLREIEITQRYEVVLLLKMFSRWKRTWIRHGEELDLMASYQDVKREETMRRVFHRWLSAARSACHRRLALQRKEKEMQLSILASFWDKWRERFKEERLRPIEYEFILQSHKNTLFSVFGLWYSKTKSIPAIRFHAAHTKAKFWHAWRASMPAALQARQAREMDKKSVLSRYFAKWAQTHRTKIALKAIARARYLRLPPSRETGARPGNLFPKRVIKTEDDEDRDGGHIWQRPFGGKPRNEASLPPRSTRESSPARSAKSSPTPWYSQERQWARPRSEQGDENSRSKLWQEFKSIHRPPRSNDSEPP